MRFIQILEVNMELKQAAKISGLLVFSYVFVICSVPANASTVTSTYPVQNTHSAPVSVTETVYFSDILDGGTVNSNNFVVHAQYRTPVTGSFTINTDNFDFDPAVNFHPGELVTSTVTDGIEAGSEMVDPYVWQYRCVVGGGEGTFVDSGQLLGGGLRSHDVELGDLDGDGDLVIWMRL